MSYGTYSGSTFDRNGSTFDRMIILYVQGHRVGQWATGNYYSTEENLLLIYFFIIFMQINIFQQYENPGFSVSLILSLGSLQASNLQSGKSLIFSSFICEERRHSLIMTDFNQYILCVCMRQCRHS